MFEGERTEMGQGCKRKRWFDDDKSTVESDLDDLIPSACRMGCPALATRSHWVDGEFSGNLHLCYPCCLANTQSQTMLSSRSRTRVHCSLSIRGQDCAVQIG
jgi:hypothetical protein